MHRQSRTAIAVTHVGFEDLGVWARTLAERGYEVSTIDATVDPVDGERIAAADLVVVLGGPIGVGDVDAYPFLADELSALRRRLDDGSPTLGVCLGAQLIAAALGAEVRSTGEKEIGYAPVTLTAAGAAGPLAEVAGVPVLHWHGDAFDIPAGAERLAETPGFPNQAFRLGDAVLGLQFHLEADPARIEQWLVGHAAELAGAGIDPRRIRADAAAHGDGLTAAARRVLETWLDAAERR